ncbi:hypothetical protein FHR75_000037 [Kineococcus radiotolerans]|uniref:Uncharacterized protein n=1 Tax=Kineococcus radiotolerans TaxID=131568 RepID=A0A7W4THY8_KINRA|nr:hypothetical protein [Kineococcus radiotolerans]MBB2899249.1 hypothetical protein [Kineococcus radiotolerans]
MIMEFSTHRIAEEPVPVLPPPLMASSPCTDHRNRSSTPVTVHLDAGYDSENTHDRRAELGLGGGPRREERRPRSGSANAGQLSPLTRRLK